MVFSSILSATVSLVVAFTGGFGGTGLWSLLDGRAEVQPLPARVCESDCSISSTVEAQPSFSTSPSPAVEQVIPASRNIDFS